jgi:hypothetical protein
MEVTCNAVNKQSKQEEETQIDTTSRSRKLAVISILWDEMERKDMYLIH